MFYRFLLLWIQLSFGSVNVDTYKSNFINSDTTSTKSDKSYIDTGSDEFKQLVFLTNMTDGLFDWDAGLFTGTGLWNNAVALETMLWMSEITKDTRYYNLVRATFDKRGGWFYNQFIDDEGWWVITMVKAYELLNENRFLETAKGLFHDMASTWSSECNGGVIWKRSTTYKNAITNSLFMYGAFRLYEVTHDTLFKEWGERTLNWMMQSGMVVDSGVNDGLDGNCQNNKHPVLTYNQGMLAAALLKHYHVTGNRSSFDLMQKVAKFGMTHLTNGNGVLMDWFENPRAETVHPDGASFKGIYIRYLYDIFNETKHFEYADFIQKNAQSIWADARNLSNNNVGISWSVPSKASSTATLLSAVSCFVGALGVKQS